MRARYQRRCASHAKGAAVVKLGGLIGGTVVSTVVWYLVEALGGGFMSAFIVSTIASGFGIYYGVKIAKRYAP